MSDPVCFSNHMGIWAIEPTFMRQAVSAIKAGTWQPRFDAAAGPGGDDRKPYGMVAPGVARVPLAGPLMKGWSKYGGTSTVWARRALRMANADPDVSEIVLHVESPGGTVAGTAELADTVAMSDKPVTAHIDDLGASAAYWVSSGAREVSANRTAEVGSIGTLVVVEDSSKAAEMAGVEVHVLSTGEFKGAFAPGAPVTDEHLEYLQARVDSLNGHFLAAVTRGRGLNGPSLDAVSDGRVFGAEESRSMGLIDAVRSFDETVALLSARVEEARRQRGTAARLRSELRAAELRSEIRGK